MMAPAHEPVVTSGECDLRLQRSLNHATASNISVEPLGAAWEPCSDRVGNAKFGQIGAESADKHCVFRGIVFINQGDRGLVWRSVIYTVLHRCFS
jgi:hypothetical protein